MATLTGMMQYLIILLIYCSLMTSNDEQFFIHLFADSNCSMTGKKGKEQTANLVVQLVKYTGPQFEA